jgi:hypothetical protein
MRRILIAALVLAAAACGNIKDEPLTQATFAKVHDSHELTPRETELLAAYMVRTAFGQMLKSGDTTTASFFDKNVTVGEAIEAQRKFVHDDSVRVANEKRAAEEALRRREAELARLRGIVTVTVAGKRKQPRNSDAWRFNDYAILSISLSNTGGKPVTGVKGRLIVRDLFDDEIITLGVKHDDAIAPGAHTVVDRFYEINPYIDREVKLYQTELEKLRVTWEPETILFADGTRLELSADASADTTTRIP